MKHGDKCVHKLALRIALFYALLAIIWIGISDVAVYTFWDDDKLSHITEIVKDIGIFLVTVVALYFAIRVEIGKRRSTEEQFQSSFENALAGQAMLSPEGVILRPNPSLCRMLGRSAEDLLGMSMQEMLVPGCRDRFIAALKSCSTGGTEHLLVEEEYLRPDGKSVWGLRALSQVPSAYARCPFLICQITDISQQKLAEKEADSRMVRLQTLRKIDTAIASGVDMKFNLSFILSQIISATDIDAMAVFLTNNDTSALVCEAAEGFDETVRTIGTAADKGNTVADVAHSRQPIRVENLQDNLAAFPKIADALASEKFTRYNALPLIAKGELLGVLELFERNDRHNGEEWEHFLETLAGQIAIAIDSVRLFEDLKRSNEDLRLAYDETIEGWSKALDLRDNETEGHTQRVTEVTLMLAKRMKLPAEHFADLRRGALLHDIGKMAVPDAVLFKPGKLTDEEWQIMRRHTIFAYELLSPIEYLRGAIDIPYCHHERWDGEGYPRGLKGRQIPLGARIFSVIDVWDALRSTRPYRKGWSEDKVRDYIREKSGTSFDPEVVEEFLKMDLHDFPHGNEGPTT